MDIIMEFLESTDINVADMIDIKIVLFLLCVGMCVKHLPFMKKLSNEFIPLILIVSSLLVSFLSTGVSDIVGTFVNAILTASIAIGIHQQGKGFLKSVAKVLNKTADSK